MGAAVFALLIYLTGLFDSAQVNGFLLSVVEHKMEAPAMQLFSAAFSVTGWCVWRSLCRCL